MPRGHGGGDWAEPRTAALKLKEVRSDWLGREGSSQGEEAAGVVEGAGEPGGLGSQGQLLGCGAVAAAAG